MNAVVCEGKEVYPSKIICVGRNYSEHIEELGNELPDEMVLFIKPNSSISNELHSVHDADLHYEAEISFLCSDGEISAVGFGLDLTKRTLQSNLIAKGLPWEKCKAFDGSAVFSEFAEFEWDESPLSVILKIDDVIVQSGTTQQMIYKPHEICEEVSRHFTLNDGDIIMTGTPKGVGAVKPSSRFEGCVMKEDSVIASGCWIAVL